MNTVLAKLRRAREERGMSLQDVSDITLINVKYLNALESGHLGILPEAYVRAFIRGYASTVGLDPAAVMKEFDAARSTPPPSPAVPAPSLPSQRATESMMDSRFSISRRSLLIAAGSVVAVIALLVLWSMRKSDEPVPVAERPFRDVVKEQEAKIAPSGPAAPFRTITTDSLTLQASVLDTCWLSISADSLPPHEYTFLPGNRAGWKARSFFAVTIGNAGGITFTLNGTKLPPLGRRGAVVRNARLSRQMLPGR
jgi:cytoskeleton protein RodZ